METYNVVFIDTNGHRGKPKTIRAQSVTTLRKRLMNDAIKSGSDYMAIEITKSGYYWTDLLEMRWGGGFNWYTNFRPHPLGGVRWNEVYYVNPDGTIRRK